MDNKCKYAANCNGKDCDAAFCERKYRLDNMFNKSLLTTLQQRHIQLSIDENEKDLAAFQYLASIAADIENFVDSGGNLFIYSRTCGNGKTSWAIKLMESYFYQTWPKKDLSCHALFISVPRFLLALKANISEPNEYAQTILKRVNEAELVVWDDIAAKIGTEFELNHLLSLIEGRVAEGKSNIYTSNLTPQELVSAVGERLASRIANLSTTVHFEGTDKRRSIF